MVILFSSNVVDPPATIYMGRDKHENEELIRWGWPEDIWFHVDKVSEKSNILRDSGGRIPVRLAVIRPRISETEPWPKPRGRSRCFDRRLCSAGQSQQHSGLQVEQRQGEKTRKSVMNPKS